MKNPWEEISLDDYENHMSLDSVYQLQTMNAIMKAQFEDYQAETAMILGIAGGNGLEHIRTEKYKAVYGIDINEGYLEKIRERYPMLGNVLRLMCLDLTREAGKLPKAELVIANLLVEYIGLDLFHDGTWINSARVVTFWIHLFSDIQSPSNFQVSICLLHLVECGASVTIIDVGIGRL